MDHGVGIDPQHTERLVGQCDRAPLEDGQGAFLPVGVKVQERHGRVLVLGRAEQVEGGFHGGLAVQRQQIAKLAHGEGRIVDRQRQGLEDDHVGSLALQGLAELLVDDPGVGRAGAERVGMDTEQAVDYARLEGIECVGVADVDHVQAVVRQVIEPNPTAEDRVRVRHEGGRDQRQAKQEDDGKGGGLREIQVGDSYGDHQRPRQGRETENEHQVDRTAQQDQLVESQAQPGRDEAQQQDRRPLPMGEQRRVARPPQREDQHEQARVHQQIAADEDHLREAAVEGAREDDQRRAHQGQQDQTPDPMGPLPGRKDVHVTV